ncbi:hypothetical protein [Neobacillus sp. LXY-1]|uniref:hypothetical protein n=1 Tax=Neobacillus sp. LXY-1 TaxID=3379133 RepID=UPI003EE28E0B
MKGMKDKKQQAVEGLSFIRAMKDKNRRESKAPVFHKVDERQKEKRKQRPCPS